MPGQLRYNNAPQPYLFDVSSAFRNAADLINTPLREFGRVAENIQADIQNRNTNDLYRYLASQYDPNNVQSINNAIRAAATSGNYNNVANDVWNNVSDPYRTSMYTQLDKENLALAKRQMDKYQTAANIARANANIAGTRGANTAAQDYMAANNIRSDAYTAQEVNDLLDSAARRGLMGAQAAATRARAGREQATYDANQAVAEYMQKWLQTTNANTNDITKRNMSRDLMMQAANDKRLNALGRYQLYSWLRNGQDNNAQINEAEGQYTQMANPEDYQDIINTASNMTSAELVNQGAIPSSGSNNQTTVDNEVAQSRREQQAANTIADNINRGVQAGYGANATWDALNAPLSTQGTGNTSSSGSNAFTNIQNTRQERQAQEVADAQTAVNMLGSAGGNLPSLPGIVNTGYGLGWANPNTLAQNRGTGNNQNITSGSARSLQATQSGTDFSNVPNDVNLNNLTPSEQVTTKAVSDSLAQFNWAEKNLPQGNTAYFAGNMLDEVTKAQNQLNASLNQALSQNGAVHAVEVINSQNPNYMPAAVRDILTVTRADPKTGAQIVEERMATRGNLINGLIDNAVIDGSGIFGYTDLDPNSDEYKEARADARRDLSEIFNYGQKAGLNDKQIALIASSYAADRGFWFGNDSIQKDNIKQDIDSFSRAFRNGSYQGASVRGISNYNANVSSMQNNYNTMISAQQTMRAIQDFINRGGTLTRDQLGNYRAAERDYNKAVQMFKQAAIATNNATGKVFGG